MKALEVLKEFLLLGLTSFGGPAAHIAYFYKRFVEELKWLDEASYASHLALCQFLPGPASSQLGFAIGLQRAGYAGALAAFIAFTLPSFFLLYALALFQATEQFVWLGPVLAGLKLFAVVVVADAVLSMGQAFCKTRLLKTIAGMSAAFLLLLPSIASQLVVLGLAAIVGACFLNNADTTRPTQQDNALKKSPLARIAGLLFIVLLAFAVLGNSAQLYATTHPLLPLFLEFYQAGSLVFGGGHVVLPLLQELVAQKAGEDAFLAAYASAQAVPGPMFTIASHLATSMAVAAQAPALVWALVATLAIFLPGLLLLLALQPRWQTLQSNHTLRASISALNAVVVGLLIAAFYQPVFTTAVHSASDMALVLAGFVALRFYKCPVLWLLFFFTAAACISAAL